MTAGAKITYTSATGDLGEFHRRFDAALAGVRAAAGGRHLCRIGGESVETGGEPLEDRSPIDTGFLLARFATAGPAEVDRAVRAAKGAQSGWARRPWPERLQVLRRAAAIIRDRKYELAALMSLEVGKSRLEAMGDTEESADLIDYYCGQVEEADGFVRPMGRITPVERNTDVLRPYGVFACIAPFNFPLALSAGMSSAALAAGNTIVYKPSEETPLTGLRLAEIYEAAGLPAGTFNFVVGRREEIGDAMWQHPGVDGVVFTGSKAVGLRIYHGLSERWVKPCLMELGGKNAALVMASADLDAAAEGVMRSAFSLQNQKCSATSRVYVHREVAAPFLALLLEKTRGMRMGDPSERDVYFGPVINGPGAPRPRSARRALRGRGAPGPYRRRGAAGRRAAAGWRLRPRSLRGPDRRAAPARPRAVPRGAVRPLPRRERSDRARPGARRGQRDRLRAHRRHLLPGRG
jgi:1-pyrroline-5-carboxylate dehydrogenase